MEMNVNIQAHARSTKENEVDSGDVREEGLKESMKKKQKDNEVKKIL